MTHRKRKMSARLLATAPRRQHRAKGVRPRPAPTLLCAVCESPDVVAAIENDEGETLDFCAECNLQRQVGGA
jgi:CRISPR/Cas system-associated protein Cas10 (large subunit of type III CRISPR-Cas system)